MDENSNINSTSTTSTLPQWFQLQCIQLRDDACTIQNLNFNIRRLSPSMMVALADALYDNVSIRELNLTSSLVMAASQQLQQCNNHSAMLLPLAQAIQQHPSLTILHLSYNRLVDVSCLAYCISQKQQGCSNMKSLTALHLDYNHLTTSTALSLAKVLQTNQTQLTTR
jgi:hypothetical protein